LIHFGCDIPLDSPTTPAHPPALDAGASLEGYQLLKKIVAAALMVAMPVSALAGDKIAVRPIQVGLQTARYHQGMATVEMPTSDATLDITPLGFDHGGLIFGVAIFNASNRPANIDVGDISVRVGDEQLRVLTADELIKKAKNRAMWATLAVALAAGVAAGAAASQRDYYRSSYSTPRGTYRWTYSAPSASGQLAAAASVAAGTYGVVQIQNQLDQTISGIGDRALQLTTIDPGESYAAKIVLTRPKKAKWPQVLHMVIRWNGKDYPFDFDVGSSKRPTPVFADVQVPDAIGAGVPTPGPASGAAPAASPLREAKPIDHVPPSAPTAATTPTT
jgi:hypothetical protein